MDDYRIICGDALAVLKGMESESVQCAITSPPYYGLRSYKTEPQIWDNHNGCEHVFGDEMRNPKEDKRPVELKISQGATVGSNVASQHWAQGTMGSECIACGSWRGELGLEPTFQLYIHHLLQIFAEVKRVLKNDGCCFVNLGDSYGTNSGNSRQMQNGNGGKSKEAIQTRYSSPFIEQPKSMHKSLLNIPHRFFIGMTDELQMIQRNNINWWKRACMPSSATDRWTVDFESIGFFTKSPKYKFNQDLEPYTKPLDRWGGQELVATQVEGWHTGTGQPIYRDRDMRPNPEGRNARTTWDIGYEPSTEEHYASYPTKLVEKMILAGTDEGDTVLDIFAGTGTTLLTALRNKRKAVGIELNPEYIKIAEKRLREIQVKLF